MKKNLLFAMLTLQLSYFSAFGQNSQLYVSYTEKADSAYTARNYLLCAKYYSKAFEANKWKGAVTVRYYAACCWALANVPDSAFANLERAAYRGNYSNYDRLFNNEELSKLRKDSRWPLLLQKVKQNKEQSESGLDKSLIHLIDSMLVEDQKWRNFLRRHYNGDLHTDSLSKEMIEKNMLLTDSLNYPVLKEIFAEYGYPGFNIVGQQGAENFWFLMQHQDSHPKFQEQVLVQMKIQVDNKNASARLFAYLTDRVKVNTHQLQVYGTQMKLNPSGTSFEPEPVVQPEKLNERRASVGLETIEKYTEIMNSTYFGRLKK